MERATAATTKDPAPAAQRRWPRRLAIGSLPISGFVTAVSLPEAPRHAIADGLHAVTPVTVIAIALVVVILLLLALITAARLTAPLIMLGKLWRGASRREKYMLFQTWLTHETFTIRGNAPPLSETHKISERRAHERSSRRRPKPRNARRPPGRVNR